MNPRLLLAKTVALFVATALAAPTLFAQQTDAPAVDVSQLLQALKSMRDQQTAQAKSIKQSALQQVNSVAGSAERAVGAWEEAIRATQFDGMAKEGAQFRAWKEGEGELLKEKEVANAVVLHFKWLSLTLQHSTGTLTKDLLPSIVNYTRELLADEAAMESLADSIKKEKEAAAIAPPGGGNKRQQPRKSNDAEIKRAHDGILKRGLPASPVVKWMKIGELITGDKWEQNPSDFDGIYTRIVLPELRAQKDPKVFEYWDTKLQKEANNATRSHLAFEVEKFNTQRRPELLWSRAQEYVNLGQKNRALTEMFTVIKTFPAHPSAPEWISQLEALAMPTPPPTAVPSDVPPGIPNTAKPPTP